MHGPSTIPLCATDFIHEQIEVFFSIKSDKKKLGHFPMPVGENISIHTGADGACMKDVVALLC